MLKIIRFAEPRIRVNGNKRKRVICECDCGNVHEYDYSDVNCGHSKQCINCARKASGKSRVTHGLIRHPLYRKWQDMKNRCYNKRVDHYRYYGALGVSVCKEWRFNFKPFYDWCMSKNWNNKLQIDRINVFGNYEPSNCQLCTATEQSFNKRNTYYIEIDGIKYSLAKLCYVNNKYKHYGTIWHGIKDKRGDAKYYIDKYKFNLTIY